jgi:hypothetical protein
MALLRALAFAIFGGFIGAAPATPLAARAGGETGHIDAGSQSQRREQAGYEVAAPATPVCAAAPPATDTPPIAAGCAASAADAARVAHGCAPALPRSGRTLRPSAEDVRAGLLDLPPPAR